MDSILYVDSDDGKQLVDSDKNSFSGVANIEGDGSVNDIDVIVAHPLSDRERNSGDSRESQHKSEQSNLRYRLVETPPSSGWQILSTSTSAGEPFPTCDEIKNYRTKQSRRLPNWLWNILLAILGISNVSAKRRWFGLLLYILTIVSALLFAISNLWYMIYDIQSDRTTQTVLDGLLMFLIGASWCGLTIYSNRLSRNLLQHSKVVDSVRLHAKSIFKINAALLVSFMAVTFIVINLYSVKNTLDDSHCHFVELPGFVCHMMFISRVIFCVFGLLWNLLVATILLSLCRTHTIGLRRFIKELEIDGRLIEWSYCCKINENAALPAMSKVYKTVMGDGTNEEQRHVDQFHWDDALLDSMMAKRKIIVEHVIQQSISSRAPVSELPQQNELHSIVEVPTYLEDGDRGFASSDQFTSYIPRGIDKRDDVRHSKSGDDMSSEDGKISVEELRILFWKLAQRLRVTALALQRWLASWVLLILLWTSIYLIYWLNHRATLYDLCQFVVPLLLLPLVCSSFAEVNMEAGRVSRAICPLAERAEVLAYVTQAPLEMNVFGIPVTYTTIMQVFVAMALAVASRVIFNMLSFSTAFTTSTSTAITTSTSLPGIW